MPSALKENLLKVSIITPFYCAEDYLAGAIESVLQQSYGNWELLLVNDGSTDNSKAIALRFGDPRIRYFEQENRGVSMARNLGLSQARGDFFCFLDADDKLPPDSLLSRVNLFAAHPELEFVDGQVIKFDSRFEKKLGEWSPDFLGNPLSDLIRLDGRSFFGPSWMVRKVSEKRYDLLEGLTHGEDLLFYMKLARYGGLYGYVNEPVLCYRDHIGSAMKNLQGLERGYRTVYNEIKYWPESGTRELEEFKRKVKQIMLKSYLKRGKISNAVKFLFNWNGGEKGVLALLV